jgi:cob(I)alamin adenosyltransferase
LQHEFVSVERPLCVAMAACQRNSSCTCADCAMFSDFKLPGTSRSAAASHSSRAATRTAARATPARLPLRAIAPQL